jgi:lysozyme family protein
VTSDNFQRAFDLLMLREGGYSNDPRDRGGETNFGVSDLADGVKDGAADLDGDGAADVKILDLTVAQAMAYYREKVWRPMNCQAMPWSVAVVLFMAGVNCGLGRASMWLQETVGTKQDGVIGGKTLIALNKRRADDVSLDLTVRCLIYYNSLGRAEYIKGWTRRAVSTYGEAMKGA